MVAGRYLGLESRDATKVDFSLLGGLSLIDLFTFFLCELLHILFIPIGVFVEILCFVVGAELLLNIFKKSTHFSITSSGESLASWLSSINLNGCKYFLYFTLTNYQVGNLKIKY